MNDPTIKTQKKGFVTEEDLSTIIRRYQPITVLRLLQEMARSPDAKIDWKALVGKTDTKISNAREYQMLWRHLAYGHPLLEKFEDEEPLDDDSDLEYEMEAFPAVSAEASAEAAACVKVLMASGLPREAGVQSNSHVEAPLTINIPNGQASKVSVESSLASSSLQGTNITVPVAVQKQSPGSFSGQKHPLSLTTSSEAIRANISATTGLPPRKKRKPWSEEEDMELIRAVKKCGEGNWANILKGDFKGDRTVSQLSKRWAFIRKKKTNISVGGSTQVQVNTNAAIRAAFTGASKQPSGGSAVNSNHATLKAPKEEYVEIGNASESQLQGVDISQSQRCSVSDIKMESCRSTDDNAQPPNQSHRDAINGDEPLKKSQNQAHHVGINVSQSQKQSLQATSNCQHQPLQAPNNFNQSQQQSPQDADHAVQSQQGFNPASATVKALHLSGSTPTCMLKSRPAPKKVPAKLSISPDSMIKAAAVAAGARIASPSEATLFKAAQAKNAVHIMSSGPSTPSVHYIRTSTPATSPPLAAGTACQTTGIQQLRGNVEPSALNVPLHQSVKAANPSASPQHEHEQKQDAHSMTQMKPLAPDSTHNSGTEENLASISGHPPSDQLDDNHNDQCNLLNEGSIVANQTAMESGQGSQKIGIPEKRSDDICNKDMEERDAEEHSAVEGDSVDSRLEDHANKQR